MAPDGTESCSGLLEAHDPGASLINVWVLANLLQLRGKPRRYAAPVDSTHFQRNCPSSRVLEKPIRASTALHPPNDAPCPMSVGQSQRHGLGTVLCDPVVVVLLDFAHVGVRPCEKAKAQDSFQVHR